MIFQSPALAHTKAHSPLVAGLGREATSVQTYRPRTEGLRDSVRRILLIDAANTIVMLLALGAVFWLMAPWVGLWLGIALSLLALSIRAVASIRHVGRERAAWSAYRLSLSDEEVTCHGPRCAHSTLRADAVARIEERPMGLLLYARPGARGVFIPRQVEAYDEVRARVAQWCAIEIVAPRRRIVVPAPVRLAVMLALLVTCMVAEQPAVIAATGLPCLAMCAFVGVAAACNRLQPVFVRVAVVAGLVLALGLSVVPRLVSALARFLVSVAR